MSPILLSELFARLVEQKLWFFTFYDIESLVIMFLKCISVVIVNNNVY
jgi:hypothetical protein